MRHNLKYTVSASKRKVAAKSFLYLFIFIILPIKISGLAFESFNPIYLQLSPDFPGPIWLNEKTFALLKVSGQLVGYAFYVCQMTLSILLTIAFYVFYNIDNQKVERIRTIIAKSLLIKVAIYIGMLLLLSYVVNPMFKFMYEIFIYNSEVAIGRTNFLYRAPETWLRSITPAITFFSMLYPMALVVFPWERKRKIEADVRAVISTGYDTKSINKWIGPAAERLANDKGWTQDDVLDGIKRAGGRHREDRSNVSRWYSGEKSMPADAIGFFLMHGVRKYYSSL